MVCRLGRSELNGARPSRPTHHRPACYTGRGNNMQSKFKVGDKLKVKKGSVDKCGSYRGYDLSSTYIRITDVNPGGIVDFYSYHICRQDSNGSDYILDTCSNCFGDDDLEYFEDPTVNVQAKPVMVDLTIEIFTNSKKSFYQSPRVEEGKVEAIISAIAKILNP